MHGDTPHRVILVKSIVIYTTIEQIHICIIHFALLISPSCTKKRVSRDSNFCLFYRTADVRRLQLSRFIETKAGSYAG